MRYEHRNTTFPRFSGHRPWLDRTLSGTPPNLLNTHGIPSTLDAAALCKMAERGQITGGIIDGPLAFNSKSQRLLHIVTLALIASAAGNACAIPVVSAPTVGSVRLMSKTNRSVPIYPDLAFNSVSQPNRVARHPPTSANFGSDSASPDVRHVADWVVNSADSRRLPFIIVDKTEAKVFVFRADGRLLGAAPALIGVSHGDDSAPGIGSRPLWQIRREDRTTPAGRFVAELDKNINGEDILWIDYDAAVSLHKVR